MQAVPLMSLLTRTQQAVAASASPRVRRQAVELDRLNRRLAATARRGEWRQVAGVLAAECRIFERIVGWEETEVILLVIAVEAGRLCAQAAEAAKDAVLASVPG